MGSPGITTSQFLEVERLLRGLSAEVSVQPHRGCPRERQAAGGKPKLLDENGAASSMIQRLHTTADSIKSQADTTKTKMEGVVQEKKALEAKLAALEAKVLASEKRAGDLDASFKHQQQQAKEQLKEKEEKLDRLGQFCIDLEYVEDNEARM